ncbi:MAG: acyl-CoA dehydrogenase family protein [Coriobacteriales bacterium]|jgi:alkylation response protein AidB-like acyl-CoA dehydrogenase
MSLVFSEEDELLRASVREFVQKEALPAMAAQQKEHGSEPWDLGLGLWHRLGELGFVGVSTPESMGGLGMGIKQDLIVEEELAASGCLAINLDGHNLGLRALEFNGTDFQKEKYGIPAAKGETLIASAISDPAGSMNFPEWTIRYEEDGDDIIINGTKNFCTNSQGADVYIIAVSDYQRGYPMTFAIVEDGTPGLEMGELEFAGKTGGNTGTIYFNDVRVPKENLFPAADYGNAPWLALGYLDFAAIMNAMAINATEIAKEYIKNRTRNGRPIAKLQAAAHRIVNCEVRTQQTRATYYAAAELWDNGTPDKRLHSVAKIAAAEGCCEVTKECCGLLGGYGMGPGSGVYELYSFAVAGYAGECPNDFHRDLIAGLDGMPQDSWLNDPVSK